VIAPATPPTFVSRRPSTQVKQPFDRASPLPWLPGSPTCECRCNSRANTCTRRLFSLHCQSCVNNPNTRHPGVALAVKTTRRIRASPPLPRPPCRAQQVWLPLPHNKCLYRQASQPQPCPSNPEIPLSNPLATRSRPSSSASNMPTSLSRATS
jgi:hypothetical protein